jgi:hypothetical protein
VPKGAASCRQLASIRRLPQLLLDLRIEAFINSIAQLFLAGLPINDLTTAGMKVPSCLHRPLE